MSVKSLLLGVNSKKPILIYEAGGNVTGNIIFSGGPRGAKLYDVKITLIRRSDYVFVEKVEKAATLNHFLTKLLSNTCGEESLTKNPGQGIVLPPDSTTELAFSLHLSPALWSSFVVPNAYTLYGIMLSARSGSEYAKKESFILKRDIIIIGQVPGQKPEFSSPFRQLVSFTSPNKEVSKMRVMIPKTWAISGERLPFKVDVWNGLTLPLHGVKVTLQQNIGYNFPSRHRGRYMRTKEARIVWQDEGPNIQPGPDMKVEWKGEVDVPYVPPTGLGCEGCPHFTVNYVLQFSISKFVNLRVQTELHIGTGSKDVMEEEEAAGWGEDISLSYGLEVTKSTSLSHYSLDWDAQSLSSEDGAGCWSILAGAKK